jgi:hypothetical protein
MNSKLKFKLWTTWFVLSVILYLTLTVIVMLDDEYIVDVKYYIIVIVNLLASILYGIFCSE